MDERDKVLIVDDEVTIRKLLKQKLFREGYSCQESDSAEAALVRLAEEPVNVIILDIRMPGRSGIEVLPEIKSKYPDTAIIMATAVTDTSLAIECIRSGADDYICKPFNLEEVTVSVQKSLEKKRLQSQIAQYQSYLENRVEEQTGEIRRIFLGAIESLVSALEAKDRYTAGHSRRVADIAVEIGNELGLSKEAVDDLHWGGLLHDVGKIAVDQMIQNKPGKLTKEEYEHIMIHAHIGAGIVRPVVNENVVEMIEHHHDRYDGHGLHQTVSGSEIPLAARILALADAFDAMTSERPYRAAMSIEEAITEIRRCMSTQFDPVVATAFLRKIIAMNNAGRVESHGL
jgi:putative two-component system response regulator